ncbi:hypothetical protein Lesp02_83510 [Lentzea sp. NBRC 105346]|uniref:hypothetical protein n=1 Tax=Lentzea sp. NBRC 105346 TaxID=3032205 RepID=UPI0024A3E33F|nr:hypothetical protein [Lentzea sp. NBRC 105346]GLZ36164.1 hypothetical protein Lesp02_83510 [Lentzea sp. NBRC 105346]
MTSHIPFGRPLFSLLEDTLISSREGRLTVHGRWGAIELGDSGKLVREALHRMGLGPVSLENIPVLHDDFTLWKQTGRLGPHWLRLRRTLDELGGCMVPSLGLHDGAGPILSLVAVAGDAIFRCPHVGDSEPMNLKPGTAIEDIDGDQVLTCPGLAYTAVLHRPPATAIAKSLLDGETTIAEVGTGTETGSEVVSDVIAYLTGAGFILTDRTGKTDRTSTGRR